MVEHNEIYKYGVIARPSWKKPERKLTIDIIPELQIKQALELMAGNEVSWYGIIDEEGDNFRLTQIEFPPQENSPTFVTTNDEKLPAWQFEKFISKQLANKVRLHGHTHPSFGVTPSATDMAQFNTLMQEVPYMIQFIINKQLQITCILYTSSTKMAEPLEVIWGSTVINEETKDTLYEMTNMFKKKNIGDYLGYKEPTKANTIANTGIYDKSYDYGIYDRLYKGHQVAKPEVAPVNNTKKKPTLLDTPIVLPTDMKRSEFKDGSVTYEGSVVKLSIHYYGIEKQPMRYITALINVSLTDKYTYKSIRQGVEDLITVLEKDISIEDIRNKKDVIITIKYPFSSTNKEVVTKYNYKDWEEGYKQKTIVSNTKEQEKKVTKKEEKKKRKVKTTRDELYENHRSKYDNVILTFLVRETKKSYQELRLALSECNNLDEVMAFVMEELLENKLSYAETYLYKEVGL